MGVQGSGWGWAEELAVLTSSNTIFMSSAGTLDTPNTPKTQFGGLYSAESVLMDAWIFSGREVFNHKSRGSILGGILVNIFINNLGEETWYAKQILG